MKKLNIILVVCSLICSCLLLYNSHELSKVKAERDAYKTNTEVLLSEIGRYDAYLTDTLHVASLGEISLRFAEYERYRAADAELIDALRADTKRLSKVVTTQTQTISQLKSIPITERIIETPSASAGVGAQGGTASEAMRYKSGILRCIDVSDRWYELHGCIDGGNTFTGTLTSWDSLLYVEHVVPKRFLGFLWKYGVKERRQEVVSKNPNTTILGAEFITIIN